MHPVELTRQASELFLEAPLLVRPLAEGLLEPSLGVGRRRSASSTLAARPARSAMLSDHIVLIRGAVAGALRAMSRLRQLSQRVFDLPSVLRKLT